MSRRIDGTTIPFLKDKGYGKGTNYTTDLVASLMLQYADAIVKSLDGDTVKLREGRICWMLHHQYITQHKYYFCPMCGTRLRPE